nr:putative zinc finger, CCHC-type [Tanacetum cinerariifolium]
MLLEGSELTKEDRESQLYDVFEHFRQHKRESIHDYYVRFAKLINDMRNIKMTMSRMQLNSKFVNNMLSEWGRFVTAVKLNRGLKDSNYDQLYAYLKQHKQHAKENKMMLERFSQNIVDPLALMSNISNPQLYSPSSSTSSSTQGQGMNPRGGSAAGYGGAQNRVGNINPGQARPGQARPVKCYNCNELILIFCPKVEMSRDVLTVGSTMRIPLLYRGEYSQLVERFMNYFEEQTDGEAMINSINNGDQPLPRVTQV